MEHFARPPFVRSFVRFWVYIHRSEQTGSREFRGNVVCISETPLALFTLKFSQISFLYFMISFLPHFFRITFGGARKKGWRVEEKKNEDIQAHIFSIH